MTKSIKWRGSELSLALMVIVAVIGVMLAQEANHEFQGGAWSHHSLGADLGYPSQDCGKNWFYSETVGKQEFLLCIVSKESVEKIAQTFKGEETTWTSQTEHALHFIGRMLGLH